MSTESISQAFDDFTDGIFASTTTPPVILKLKEDLPTNRKSLHKNELARLDNYRPGKRRREYLTGRICAKKAVNSYLDDCGLSSLPSDRIEIATLESGHPLALLHPVPDIAVPHISISHSKELATAMSSSYPCGIDLQKIEKKLLKVRKKFCSESEIRLLAGTTKKDELSILALLWCAKEAIQKRFGHDAMPGFSEIHLQQCVQKKMKPRCCFQLNFSLCKKQDPPPPVTVVATTFSDYALALTTRTKEENNA